MITRVRARQKGITGYINAMRPGWLGNPFSLEGYSLEESLKKFRIYLNGRLIFDPVFRKRFFSIDKNATIGCSCTLTKPCHVDIIIEIYNMSQK